MGRVLPGQVGIRIRGAVARGNVQHAIRPKCEIAAVVPIRRPLDDHGLGTGDDPVGGLTRQGIALGRGWFSFAASKGPLEPM